MQALRKATEKKETIKEEEKLKRIGQDVSTPRNYLPKSSTTDIYGQKNKISLQNAPKKSKGSSSVEKTTPMKSYLKSSSSSVSVGSVLVNDQKNSKTNSTRTLNKLVDSARSDKLVSVKKSLTKTLTSTPESKRKLKGNSKETVLTDIDSKVKDAALATHKKSKDLISSMTPQSIRKTKQNSTPESSRKIKETSKSITHESSKRIRSLPTTSITVNSPPVKKKVMNVENSKLDRGDSKEIGRVRQRTKTRTLNENEVKVLTPDLIDNNTEMLNLSKRLSAKPKAFYVELEDDVNKKRDKLSDEDYSYSDDFESYESDFDSYHSSAASASEKENTDDAIEGREYRDQSEDKIATLKDGKDEENMMDSGSFDLRESQRSANKMKSALMANILEDCEDLSDKKSFTDEGFQEMSSSSGMSSMKTVHVDVLHKPLFMDFTKSKENRKKKKANERLKQRAKDLLSMITLHEMSYSLFEMKPIPYDMYMATFGRSNYTQSAVQTFDDAETEEVQTEEILCDTKWTQHPVEFSHHDIYLKPKDRKQSASNEEDYLSKFTILLSQEEVEVDLNNKINVENDYKLNPLRIYFEQKNGVGPCEMLPYEKYKAKVNNQDFDSTKLSKFLKKVESKVCNIINRNTGDLEVNNISQNSKLSFSKGYVSISTKTITNEQLLFVKSAKVLKIFFSETKPHILMTAHKRVSFGSMEVKCLICLWDINVSRDEPLKVLVAIDDVKIGRYRGDTDGIFTAALEDGSLHVWDLSEEPTWQNDITLDKPDNLIEVKSDRKLSQTEIDRKLNFEISNNKDCKTHQIQKPLQSCAFTSSAYEMNAHLTPDPVTGLLLMTNAGELRDGGRKLVGQICVLQRIGKLIIWSIVQERAKANHDMGKAFWSKIKLEKLQTISLLEQFDIRNPKEGDKDSFFNLNAAKKRLTGRRLEKKIIKQYSRPKSAVSYNSSEYDIDRPASAASVRSVISTVEKSVTQTDVYSWESGIICNDLKMMRWNEIDNYLVAKNCGEVLLCTQIARTARVERFCVAKDMGSVTCVEVPRYNVPYFLAATDTGTIHLCSLRDSRVLLTLDCRNGPPAEYVERYQTDHLGRFVSSVKRPTSHTHTNSQVEDPRTAVKLSVSNLHWSKWNPCLIYSVLQNGAVLSWELTYSDITARAQYPKVCVTSAHAGNSLALLTPEGEVQIHRLTNDQGSAHYLDLFEKYVALL